MMRLLYGTIRPKQMGLYISLRGGRERKNPPMKSGDKTKNKNYEQTLTLKFFN